ncbi:endonuclease I [Mesorhizobium sp. L2C067A000]|uniref:endonuclease I n=1 Tax=Mesorhizobium sp. L2C067A000 TaxID=1287106 RepID=UPI0003D05CE4|nr:endonuclease I [Mesorhizobium sp. L2C067A000]ESZ06841.1 endonuclease I [Mesorhizobium sp. L2C089B000]ESZ33223.1 endonuclease I [Mesorhizobium sp. L2C067A000]
MTTDLNRYRSGLEREVARQLKLAGRSFEFETVKIDYLKPAKKAKYNPDFVIRKRDGSPMYIESKGRFLTADRQKHLLIRAQFPDIDIRFVFQRASEKIGKGSATTYAKWAEDKGYKWADKGKIPKEWLEE